MEKTPPTPAPKNADTSMWTALSLVGEIGYIIAIPAFLFGFGGAYVDKTYGISPFGVLVGLLIALLLSGSVITLRIKRILSKL